MKTKFKVALAQVNPALGNLEKNIKKHTDYITKAVKKKADLIVFPELSLTGYSLKDLNAELAINLNTPEALNPLCELSRKIDIICGGVEEDDNYGLFNAAFFISGGRVKFTHRKLYPPDYGMFEEIRYFSKGKKINILETQFGKIGILVCEDLWHISLPLIQALNGAKIIITIAASPTRLELNTKSKIIKNYEINSEHHKSYARLLSLYMVFCNRVGYEDGVNFWGGSEVVDPFGQVTALGKFFDEDLIIADINFDKIKRARQQARHFVDEDKNFIREQARHLLEKLDRL
jgi:NAD+ synthase (glutamine-hydrolysing)